MNLKTAGKLFSLDPDTALEGEIKTRFAELVSQDHPDHGGDGSQIRRLKQARDRLMTYVSKREDCVDCELCNGTGSQKTRSGGLIPCSRCGGEGEYVPRKFKRG